MIFSLTGQRKFKRKYLNLVISNVLVTLFWAYMNLGWLSFTFIILYLLQLQYLSYAYKRTEKIKSDDYFEIRLCETVH